jgi:hypothetical protein
VPRFYFHFQDGSSRLNDPEGMELPDAEAAWYQAVRSARELVRGDSCSSALKPGGYVEIRDERGWQVWAVPYEEVIGLAV